MAGARVEVTGTAPVRALMAKLAAKVGGPGPVLDALGDAVEGQTRRRLSQDKEGPNGEPWPEWSAAYAKTRHGNHKLLDNEGHLIDSIHYMVQGDAVHVGSERPYAAIQHFGGAEVGKPGLPARAYLGVGRDDMGEIEEVLGDWLGRIAA